LCSDALRLVRLLTEMQHSDVAPAFALRALLCFHASRLPARFADDGTLLLLPEQDRSRWDGALIQEAFTCLDAATGAKELSRFHIEAAIAACHAIAPTYAATDWARIAELYDLLRERAPSMVVDVNRALAIAMHAGARAGLDELDVIPEREVLARYPYALAAYASLHASLGQIDEARKYLDRALEHQSSPAQRGLLQRKRAALDTQQSFA
jgi:RNA polymerase sigma-70 factor (ECF subfamily)